MNEKYPVSRDLCEVMTERMETRLNKHGETLDELKTCAVRLTEIAEAHNEKLSDYGRRLGILERNPARFLERAVTALLTALAAALVATFI